MGNIQRGDIGRVFEYGISTVWISAHTLQVAKALDKSGGIALGHTTVKAVWSRHDVHSSAFSSVIPGAGEKGFTCRRELMTSDARRA